MKTIAIYYLNLLPVIREAAANCHYAIGLHGSMERDLDLIAVPWLPEATPAGVLVEKIREAVGGYWNENAGRNAALPTEKPHGRLAWSITLGGGAYIDLSVMPLAKG